MMQPVTKNQRSSYPYLNPLIRVVADGHEIGALVSKFGVVSDLREKADTCVLMVSDTERTLEGALKRGSPLSIVWGYVGDELTEIFRGVVRDIGNSGRLVIKGIDWNVLLNSLRVDATFQEETISGIVKAILSEANLGLKIEDCDFTPERFPGFGRTVRECLDELSTLAERETGEPHFDYVRGGVFYWGRKLKEAKTVMSFQSGVNIIRTEPSGNDLSLLETMVVGVQHSQMIEVDGERRFVLRCEYLWDAGGRTRIWSERAG